MAYRGTGQSWCELCERSVHHSELEYQEDTDQWICEVCIEAKAYQQQKAIVDEPDDVEIGQC